jgi:hypothetical protein
MKRAIVVLATCVIGCSNPPPKSGPTIITDGDRYESVVQILHRDVVEQDKEGKITQVDIEVEWDPCPGEQFQMIRGGPEFAACTEKMKVQDYVPVVVLHWWDARGYYRWDIEKLGDCAHRIEDRTPGSYERGQECRDVTHYTRKAGFICSRKPKAALVEKCPWMKRE